MSDLEVIQRAIIIARERGLIALDYVLRELYADMDKN